MLGGRLPSYCCEDQSRLMLLSWELPFMPAVAPCRSVHVNFSAKAKGHCPARFCNKKSGETFPLHTVPIQPLVLSDFDNALRPVSFSLVQQLYYLASGQNSYKRGKTVQFRSNSLFSPKAPVFNPRAPDSVQVKVRVGLSGARKRGKG